jgi:glycosyltransferase involved in cell wall biosynthesis
MERPAPSISVVHVLAPARFGGLESVIQTLAPGQVAAGDSVCVVPVLEPHESEGHPVVGALRASGIDVAPVVVSGRDYRGERSAIEAVVLSRAADVVHTHGYRPDVIDAPVARRLGIPTVTTVHGFTRGGFGRGGWRGRFYEWLQIRSFRKFEAVVVVSDRLRGELVQEGVPVDRVHVLRNAWASAGHGLDRQAARSHLGVEGEGPAVAWVGRLSSEKAPDIFVRAVGEVRSHSGSFHVVGAGKSAEECRALASSLGVADRIHWLGAVPDAGRYLSAFDALVMTSWTEGTPMVLLEAMAAGVPVVTTAVGGIPDVVSPDEAILCEAGDVTALAAGIDAILADPDVARTRAAAARRRLETEFAVEPWVRRYREIYQSILADR